MPRRSRAREALLTPHEACEVLGIHYDTLTRWTREGRMPFTRLPNGRLRFDPVVLDQWLASRQRGA